MRVTPLDVRTAYPFGCELWFELPHATLMQPGIGGPMRVVTAIQDFVFTAYSGLPDVATSEAYRHSSDAREYLAFSVRSHSIRITSSERRQVDLRVEFDAGDNIDFYWGQMPAQPPMPGVVANRVESDDIRLAYPDGVELRVEPLPGSALFMRNFVSRAAFDFYSKDGPHETRDKKFTYELLRVGKPRPSQILHLRVCPDREVRFQFCMSGELLSRRLATPAYAPLRGIRRMRLEE